MRPEIRKFLADMLEAVKCIEKFTKDRKFEEMGSDDMLRASVYWEFVVIGEALAQLRRIDEAPLIELARPGESLASEIRSSTAIK